MKQSCVRTLARFARSVALAAVALGFGASALAAQATGKLEGRIRDQADQPVANARVIIEGTALTATADPRGYYFINNVPAGTYAIRVQYVGYKPVRYEGVRMLSGQTITQDVKLEATAVEIQELTVVAADQALVPRDKVTSKQIVDGSFTDKLPVDRISNVLALQPGVMASPGGGTLSVRGGRADENNTYIDGVSVQSGLRGNASRGLGTISVGVNSFEDASVTTGATSAEFGNAQGGVIAITTRTGGQTFSGNVGYETDEFAGSRYSGGFNRLQASLGGPITKNLTFFAGAVLEGTRFGQAGYKGWEVPSWHNVGIDTTYAVPNAFSTTADTSYVDVYKYAVFTGECDNPVVANAADPDIRNNYGYECQGNRTRWTPSSTYQLTSKLNYSFGQGSRIALSFLSSRGQSRGQRGSDFTSGSLNRNNVLTMNWTQTLTKSSDRAIALDAYVSYQWDRALGSALTPESEESTRNPFLGWMLKDFDFIAGINDFPVTDDLVKAYRLQTEGAPITLFDRRNPEQYNGQRGYAGAVAGIGDGAGGGGGGTFGYNAVSENRLIGKVNLDWQLDRYNRLKIGGEYTSYDLWEYNVGSTSAAFSDLYRAEPVRYNFFLEDRLDLGDVVLVGGLRYDYFDVGASKWKGFPRISSAPGFTPDQIDNYLEPYKSHDAITPHIQVAFPVTERTNFRLSYAQMVQAPDFGVVLQGSNTDLSITNTNNNYGTDLDFGKTILFEFGVGHAFSDDMVLDVTVYNKDNLANPAGRLIPLIDPLGNDRNDIRLTVNQDFGNTRGIDVRLDRRFGNIFNGVISYSFQDARNTGSDPYTYINFGSRIISGLGGTNAPPAQAAQPVGFSRPHSIAGQFSFNFPSDYKQGALGAVMNRLGINGVFRYASGTPYTRCSPDDPGSINVTAGSPCARELAGDFNAARRPAYKEFNLRVTKGFALGGLDMTAYVDGRNILNLENISSVFTQTGSISNPQSVKLAWETDSLAFRQAGLANGIVRADGALVLPTSNAACQSWRDTGGLPSAPSCHYYRKDEARFGNGDGVYTMAEQRRSSDQARFGTYHISNWAFGGRAIRLGMEVNF